MKTMMRPRRVAIPSGKVTGSLEQKLGLVAVSRQELGIALGLVPVFAWEGDITPHTPVREIQRIRRLAEDMGVELAALGAFIFWPPNPCLTDEDPEERCAAIALLQRQVELAWELGVPTTSVAIANRKRPDLVPECLEELASDSLSRVQVPQGMTLAVEHLLDRFTSSPVRLRRLLDRVRNTRIGWQFDPANVLAERNYREEELRLEPGETIDQVTDPAHWLAIVGRPTSVDVKGIDLTNKEPWMPEGARTTSARFWPPCLLVPDLLGGSIDWTVIIQKLDEYAYDGWLVYEGLKHDEAAILDLWKLVALQEEAHR